MARSRHRHVTDSAVAWRRGPARSRAAAPLCGLRPSGPPLCDVVPRRASSASGRRCASAAGARAPGPSGAASNARAGGWRSHGRAARSSTTLERGPSSPPGRSEAVATSPRRWPSSSPRSSPHPASTCSRSCRATASAAESAVTCRPQAWRAALGSRWGLPVECLLSRRDGSKRQAGLLRAERRANVRGAFMSRGASPAHRCDRRRHLHDGCHGLRLRHCCSDAPARAAWRSFASRGQCDRLKSIRRGGAMRLNLTVRHGQVNPGVRSYVESKFAKLGRRLHDGTLVEVVLDRERNPKIADDHVVEAALHVKGPEPPRSGGIDDVRGRDGPPRRQARASDRAAAGQEGPRAAPSRPGRTAGACARGGDRAGAPHGAGRLSASVPLPHDPGPHWGEVGIHGLHRPREWDAVLTVEAPDVPGDEGWFVVLADGRVLVEEEQGGDVGRLARAVTVPAPVSCARGQARTRHLGDRCARDRHCRARRRPGRRRGRARRGTASRGRCESTASRRWRASPSWSGSAPRATRPTS